MKFLTYLLVAALVGCSSQKPPPSSEMPNEKAFEVPADLANKFVVKEEAAPAPIASATAPTPPAAENAKGKKEPKGKKTKGAKVAASAKEKTKFVWPNRWNADPFFQTGERYNFDITYFGATAGNLKMELLPNKTVNERSVYHIRAEASTASVFSLFYRLNDVAESFMDTESLVSLKFQLKLDESLQQRDVLELYDQKDHKVHYWSKLDHKKKGKKEEQAEIATEPWTQDGISAFFYLRTLPMEIGKEYSFPVVTNGKMRNVRVQVVRKEKITTKIGVLPAIVIKPEVVLDGVLKSYGDSFVWISDDPRRIILKIDAKIKVGSIVAYLKEHAYGAVQTGP